ncbi:MULTISPECIES: hypothetical protein [Rhizobium/Agrobacterium group]|jgi:hypothetical protein|uniref:Transmembrane protein n=1 Tax=Rhizobium soli TaxID=424798 RepID=A0A7X0JNU7_9HYPH|nr:MULTISPECIES: hypothetical protein [Rhizobium/Agrobacterium group]RYE67279.1 MAG: hypothetical protein EOP17_09170 [Rhizobiaceae bacterium]KQQ38669.1 hypothetical protein ASG19_06490 [Rhizobium sp. Leaf306]KQQ78119.1 hypothetical protein ASF70_02560 [Rhizobium sp. Leaf321]MBB6511013.1 hypothetical protein [Rhizobium soli]MBD8665253.1 hypothetical protein [Rhizobium sp. CFBP 8752]
MEDEFWKTVQARQRAKHRSGRTGALNIALLFGTAAVALALIVTPMLAGHDDQQRLATVKQDFDMITTGSIKPVEKGTKTYTIRRSVLQDTPGSVCIVQGYGANDGC